MIGNFIIIIVIIMILILMLESFKKSKKINKNNSDKKENNNINTKEKGAIYEEHVSNIYRNKNYTIAEHGKDNGVKDFGIDVIAKRDREILFIQCKNWKKSNKYKINVKEIQYTRMNVRDYLEKNIMFKDYDWKIIYATSEDILDRSAKYKIRENSHEIEHKVIPI